MSEESEVLYQINDRLTQLASDLNVYFKSPDDEDRILNELTHRVAEAFDLFSFDLSDNQED